MLERNEKRWKKVIELEEKQKMTGQGEDEYFEAR